MEDLYKHLNLTISFQKFKLWFCQQQDVNLSIYIEHFCSNAANNEVDEKEYLQLLIITVTIFISGLILHILLLHKIINVIQRHCCFILLTNLIVTGILILISMMAFMIYIFNSPQLRSDALHLHIFPSIDILLSSVSLFSISVMSIEKVTMTSNAVKIKGLFHPKLYKRVLIGIWVYNVIIFMISLSRVYWKFSQYFETLFTVIVVSIILLSCFITVVYYLTIACKMLSQSCRSNIDSPALSHFQPINKKKRSKVLKNSLISISVFLPFTFGWIFYLSINSYEILFQTFIDNKHLDFAMIIVPWIVTATNPIVIIAFNKSFRKLLISKVTRKKDQSNETLQSDIDTITELWKRLDKKHCISQIIFYAYFFI